MIGIQLILIVSFLVILWRFLLNPNSYQIRAGIKLFTALLTLIAIVVVLFPDSSNSVAHWLGVKRGADLLLYMLVLAFIFQALSLYVRDVHQSRRVAKLTRRLAILEVELDQKSGKDK